MKRKEQGEVWSVGSASSCLTTSSGSGDRNRGRADTQTHIFPLPLSFSLFRPALLSSRKRKGGVTERGGVFDGSEGRTLRQRAVQHSNCGNMMEASLVSDTG